VLYHTAVLCLISCCFHIIEATKPVLSRDKRRSRWN
jgi:hypothetical protein